MAKNFNMLSVDNERMLLLLISKGNKMAFHTLFEAYRDKIYSFALFLTNADFLAEEITQEVFIKIWTIREKLAEIDSFKAYLNTIVRNVATNYLKRTIIEKLVYKRLYEDGSGTHDEQEVHDEQIDNIMKIHEEAIKLLSPQQHKAYKLHHIQGIKVKEVAEIMNISTNTVREYLKDALKTVRKYVGTKVNLMVLLAISIYFN